MIKKYKYLNLALWIAALQLIAILLGALSTNAIDTWYLSINRSSLTPPNIAFPIVWTTLYIMIAVAGWLLWSTPKNANVKFAQDCFILQLIFNWAWTPIFFNLHLTGLALIDLLLIIIFTSLVILNTYKKHVNVALLLTPYLIWTMFAGYLNFFIWYYN